MAEEAVGGGPFSAGRTPPTGSRFVRSFIEGRSPVGPPWSREGSGDANGLLQRWGRPGKVLSACRWPAAGGPTSALSDMNAGMSCWAYGGWVMELFKDSGQRHNDYVLLRVKEVAVWLRLSRSTIYEWAASGKIPWMRIGGALRCNRSDVLRRLESRKEGR